MTDRSPSEPSAPHPRSSAIQQRRISRIPAFTPVPVRARADGWSPVRQGEFIGYLAETRCVRTAAARVGMSRESAYRLRKRMGAVEFVAAWESIMGNSIMGNAISGNMHTPRSPKAKVTLEGLYQRIKHGTLRPVMRGGRYVGTLQKPDNSALRSVLGRVDRTANAAERRLYDAESHTKQKGRSV